MRPRGCIVDTGVANLRSIAAAISAVGGEATTITSSLGSAEPDFVVLPGVGNYGRVARHLRETGIDAAIHDWHAAGVPILGICLGMQLLGDRSEESPGVRGLGLLPYSVSRIVAGASGVKIPHVGFDDVHQVAPLAMLRDAGPAPDFYFVHSYCLTAVEADRVGVTDRADCEYGVTFAACFEAGNLWATQFHPEKSQAAGLAVLSRFVEFAATC